MEKKRWHTEWIVLPWKYTRQVADKTSEDGTKYKLVHLKSREMSSTGAVHWLKQEFWPKFPFVNVQTARVCSYFLTSSESLSAPSAHVAVFLVRDEIYHLFTKVWHFDLLVLSDWLNDPTSLVIFFHSSHCHYWMLLSL